MCKHLQLLMFNDITAAGAKVENLATPVEGKTDRTLIH